MTEKKLVEAFRTFFEKSVIPNCPNSDVLQNEWKMFNSIISNDPVDPNQLDFYVYMANKQTSSPSYNKTPAERQTTGNLTEFSRFGKTTSQVTPPLNTTLQNRQNLTNSGGGSKRKVLVSNLQNFQSMLVRNQDKLQSFNKGSKDTSFNTSITSNGTSKKHY